MLRSHRLTKPKFSLGVAGGTAARGGEATWCHRCGAHPGTCQAGSLWPGCAQQCRNKPSTPKSSRKPANQTPNPKPQQHLPLTSSTSLLGLLGRRSPEGQGLDLGKCLKILRILFVTSPKQVAAAAFPPGILGARSSPGTAQPQMLWDTTSTRANCVCSHERPFPPRR